MLHMAERACVDVGSPFQYVAEDEPAADRSGRDGRQGDTEQGCGGTVVAVAVTSGWAKTRF